MFGPNMTDKAGLVVVICEYFGYHSAALSVNFCHPSFTLLGCYYVLINTIFGSFSCVCIDRLPFSEGCSYEILKLDQSH